MKRRALIRHLLRHGCEQVREGSRHSIWRNPVTGDLTTVPRHAEINEHLARKICKDLGIDQPS
ncbi:MAG TPA: type II toxin-antitoxin system HicA family toxin [Methylothermaceae bacterium]|nr:type II toxin-antitoxin system HicA family toxin [Methylothermaceae bacterium]